MCAMKLNASADVSSDACKSNEPYSGDVSIEINLKDLEKDGLIEILKDMETELEACEIACNILKFNKTKPNTLKYTCYDSLQRDDKLFESAQNFEKLKVKTMKSHLNDDKKALSNLIFTNEESLMIMKTHIMHLQDQYHNACIQLADEKKQWVDYQDKFCKFQEKTSKDMLSLNQELDKVIEERNSLLDKLQSTEEELVHCQTKCKFHQDGATLLADDRVDLISKINLLAGSLDFLEDSIEQKKANCLCLKSELEKLKRENKDLKSSHTLEIESLKKAYEDILKAKDNKIKQLEDNLCKKVDESRIKVLQSDSTTAPTTATKQQQQFQQLNEETQTESIYDNLNSTNGAIFMPTINNVDSNNATGFATVGNNRQVASSNDLYNMVLNKDLILNSTNTIKKNYSAANSFGLTPNSSFGGFDIFGPEMANLQELLVFPSSLNGSPGQTSTPRKESTPVMIETPTYFNTPSTTITTSTLLLTTNSFNNTTPFHSINNTTPFHNINNATTSTTATEINPKQYFLTSVQFNISNDNPQILREILKSPEMDKNYFNEKLPNGLFAQHYAVECCADECLRVLLESGYNADVLNDDEQSPLHLAAMEGNILCLKLLIEHGGCVNRADHIGMTPLHLSSNIGHVDCCLALLQAGASIDAINLNLWSPIHLCIFSGSSQCLKQMLTFRFADSCKDAIYEEKLKLVVSMVDGEGRTAGHLATIRQTKDCLEVLMKHCSVDLDFRDKFNKSALEVASSECLSFILRSESSQEITCTVSIDIDSDTQHISKSSSFTQLNYNTLGGTLATTSSSKNSSSEVINNSVATCEGSLDASTTTTTTMTLSTTQKQHQQCCIIGCLVVSRTTSWIEIEEKLATTFLNHISEVSIGLRTKKISKSENQDSSDSLPNPFTMGITVKSIKYYSIGKYHWSPGKLTDKSPYELLNTQNSNSVNIKLFDADSGLPDGLAYESMVPIYVLHNYLKIIQQQKCVVFYGSKGTGKSYLSLKLARYLQVQEGTISCSACDLHLTNLHPSFSSRDLIKLLIDKGCLIDAKLPLPPPKSIILIFDDLTQINVDEVFKDVAQALENRGPAYPYVFKTENGNFSYYMHPNCYIIGTMDRPRSTGIDISIQQRFKWLQMRCDQEPCKYLLHRHLLRDLSNAYLGSIPMPDNSVYKAVEWLICVWQRLNDGVMKLGLNQLNFGPCYFLSCPVERNKPKAILRWMISLWNKVIAPNVSESILKSSKSSSINELHGQQKVTNTALYVLMQRAIVSGCPLTNQERDRYLSSFYGSNELDIKIKNEKKGDQNLSSSLSSPSKSSSLSSPIKLSSSASASPFKSVSTLSSSSSSSSSSHPQFSIFTNFKKNIVPADTSPISHGQRQNGQLQQKYSYPQQNFQQQKQYLQQQKQHQQPNLRPHQQQINPITNNNMDTASPVMSRSFNNELSNNTFSNNSSKSSTNLNKTAPFFNKGNNFASAFSSVGKNIGNKLATPSSAFNVVYDSNVVVKQPTK